MSARTVPDIIRRNWNAMIDGVARRKDADVTKWYGLMLASYREDHRAYHTLDHIAAMLDDFERCRDQFDNPQEVLAAIFFHDIVYQVTQATANSEHQPVPAGYNEKKSARIARMALSEMGFDRAFCKRAAHMINATADHKLSDKADRDLALFLDMDMAILGAAPSDYRRYCDNVRTEYGAFDDLLFYQGRLHMFVKPVLASPPIFQTQRFRDKYEAAARRNLMDEQRRLTKWLEGRGADMQPAPKPD